MQRRTIYVGSCADVERIAAGADAMPICPADVGDTPITGLLMLEIRRIEKWTRMTELQAVVLEWSFRGFSNEEIAALRDMTPKVVSQVLHRAREKCMAYPNRGLLTVLIETLGWEGVQEMLANR